jgi:hypothetical protein
MFFRVTYTKDQEIEDTLDARERAQVDVTHIRRTPT